MKINFQVRVCVLILSVCCLISCSEPKVLSLNDQFEECLPKQFNQDIDKLTISFKRFIDRSYNGKIENFITPITNRILPNSKEFFSQDFTVAKELSDHQFLDSIYTKISKPVSKTKLQKSKATTEEVKVREKTILDPMKPYLNCINKLDTNNKFITSYQNLQSQNTTTNTLPLCKLYLETKDNADFNVELVEKIIAVELYYSMLNAIALRQGNLR